MKDTIICFRITRELRDVLQKLSQTERRSLSSTIENILYSYFEERKPRESGAEKRRHLRKKVEVPVLIRDKNGFVYPGGTVDISLGGISLSVNGDLKCGVGEDYGLSLVFALSEGEKPVTLGCVPRHVSGTGRVRIGAYFRDDVGVDYDLLCSHLMN
jgi:hypothetical protein